MENQHPPRLSSILSYLSLSRVTNEGVPLEVILCVSAAVLLVSIYLASKDTGRPLPPGPRAWPIIGNALQIPKEGEWLTFTEWGKIYGDIISLTGFGRTIIILNSSKIASDLLEKRSSIYSDRPILPFVGELVRWELALGLTRYGEYFRQMRRLMHQILSPRPAQDFWPTEEQEAARFMNRLLQSPENFVDHIRHMVGTVVLKISHGYTPSEDGKDPLVELAGKVMKEFSLGTTPGAYWVDFLPWLKYIPSWFPGAGFKRTALEWRNDLLRMAEDAHNFTKGQMEMGTFVPSFTSKLLEGDDTSETEYLVKWTAFSIYAGGADTSVSSITTFFLAMCLHPEVQVIAQAELDAVIGPGRLPTMKDRPSLPYIEAILKEVLRWGPVAVLGIPHRLIEEDEYDGYRIPAGSVVIGNIWAMTHNPDVFPQPDEFYPGRFFGPNKTDANPLEVAFGFGRRVCPGQYLAESTLFLAMATTLATFSISKSRDKQTGKIIEPTVSWSPGLINHPVPFSCDIKPRSAHAVDLIKRAVAPRNG